MSASKRLAIAEREALTSWLFDLALPLWASTGTDWQHGGFFETIDKSGEASRAPRRTRVVGRQIYSFATADALGWKGPGLRVAEHGLKYLTGHCLKADGTVMSVSHPESGAIDDRFDLYDHAFAMFGLAAAAKAGSRTVEMSQMAATMRDRMKADWGHAQAGFEESIPRTLPLKANPHMHVFEAALAWAEVKNGVDDPAWGELADEIAELCLAQFIAPSNGALREFFDGDWLPLEGDQGRIVEPGHQFEWGWLLIRWGQLRTRPDAIEAALRLIEIGETHGADPVRGVAMSELWDDLTVKDSTGRLWQQTERIKAWLAVAAVAETEAAREDAWAKVALAAAGLRKYFVFPVLGGCWENMNDDGSFRDEAARASSLYHIVCAITEMHKWL